MIHYFTYILRGRHGREIKPPFCGIGGAELVLADRQTLRSAIVTGTSLRSDQGVSATTLGALNEQGLGMSLYYLDPLRVGSGVSFYRLEDQCRPVYTAKSLGCQLPPARSWYVSYCQRS